jgi:hypothetical protein
VTHASLAGAYDVEYYDGHCYVASYSADAITVVDVSTPASPSVVGSVTDASLAGAIHIARSGDYLYVSCYDIDTVTIVDITTPTSPAVINDVADGTNLNGAWGIVTDGDYCYAVGQVAERLAVVEIVCA